MTITKTIETSTGEWETSPVVCQMIADLHRQVADEMGKTEQLRRTLKRHRDLMMDLQEMATPGSAIRAVLIQHGFNPR